MWNANITSLNFTGFLAPTWPNGSVMAGYDPLSCGACEWDSISYEGVPWEYSFSIPHDISTLITLMAGPETFESRLDTMFTPQLSSSDVGGNGIGSMIFNPGNEPSFMTPFLYNYVSGRQSKSVMRAKNVVDEFYGNGRSGLPGNDDAGALSSWLVWVMMGLYPVATQPVYLLLSPWFDEFIMSVGNGTLKVTVDRQGGEGVYVQSLRVNGEVWTKSWIEHEVLVRNGGVTIEYVLGEEMVAWDIGDVPPSPGKLGI
jgi:putative alpha-1,2-mannosidase